MKNITECDPETDRPLIEVTNTGFAPFILKDQIAYLTGVFQERMIVDMLFTNGHNTVYVNIAFLNLGLSSTCYLMIQIT